MAMGPLPAGAEADDADLGSDGEAGEADEDTEPTKSFAELLGPDCVIKRVDKDRNVVSHAKPEEMQQELMTRAAAQKRIGACADHVRSMGRLEKLQWALDLKDQANELYAANNFEEASKLYNDCLVALDLEGTPEENEDVQTRLQLPVCTNLAACMIETGMYGRCIEICDIALSVDDKCPKALYRRGLAHYRMGNHSAASPDFEVALRLVRDLRQQEGQGAEVEARGWTDLERRISVYLGHIRRHSAQEKARCQKMFDKPLYKDRPDVKETTGDQDFEVDDSDEAIDAALARRRGQCCSCLCSRRVTKAKTA